MRFAGVLDDLVRMVIVVEERIDVSLIDVAGRNVGSPVRTEDLCQRRLIVRAHCINERSCRGVGRRISGGVRQQHGRNCDAEACG